MYADHPFPYVDCILIFGHEHLNVHACTPCMKNEVFKVWRDEKTYHSIKGNLKIVVYELR